MGILLQRQIHDLMYLLSASLLILAYMLLSAAGFWPVLLGLSPAYRFLGSMRSGLAAITCLEVQKQQVKL